MALAGDRTMGSAESSVSGLQVNSNSGKGCAQKCSASNVTFFVYRNSSQARE